MCLGWSSFSGVGGEEVLLDFDVSGGGVSFSLAGTD